MHVLRCGPEGWSEGLRFSSNRETGGPSAWIPSPYDLPTVLPAWAALCMGRNLPRFAGLSM